MKVYKAGIIYKYTGAPFLEIWQPNLTRAQVSIPAIYRHLLQKGMTIREYSNSEHAPIAYSFGGNLVFTEPLQTKAQMKEILNSIPDIYRGSLDRMMFKYDLGRCLQKNGLIATPNTLMNMVIYAVTMKTYQGER